MIAIIDSGVNAKKLTKIEVIQYRVLNSIKEEEPVDYIGHGTAMAGVILDLLKMNPKIISLRPGGTEGGYTGETITATDIARSIVFAVDKGAKIINISMGVDTLRETSEIEAACNYAFDKGVPILASKSTKGNYVVPWSCAKVLKVSHEISKAKSLKTQTLSKNCLGIVVNKMHFRSSTQESSTRYLTGNSAATAYMAAMLYSTINKSVELKGKSPLEMIQYLVESREIVLDEGHCFSNLFNGIKMINGEVSHIKKNTLNFGNCIITPFSKEATSFYRFSELLDFTICDAVDPILKGNNGKDPNLLVGGNKTGYCIKNRLSKLNLNTVNTLIIGYIDEVEKWDEYFNIDTLLVEALSYNLNVYSFTPIPIQYYERFDKQGLWIKTSPQISQLEYEELKNIVPKEYQISTPVLGVFGTSSKQGKFTLQLRLREAFKKNGVKLSSVGTEHFSDLLGFDLTLPLGYLGSRNVSIDLIQQSDYIRRAISYIEYVKGPDLIMVGGQSWLLPYDIENQTLFGSTSFLEGVRPDVAILVVNPYTDHPQYIKDTIAYLESVYKCKVLALAFSDKCRIIKNNSIVSKKIDSSEAQKFATELNNDYSILAGCIMDDEYISLLIKRITSYLT